MSSHLGPGLRLALAVAALAILPAPATAQNGVSSLLRRDAGSHLVEPGPVLETARASFERAAREHLGLDEDGDEPGDSLSEDRRHELLVDAVEAFAAAADRRTSALQGDGLLMASEVSDALSDLRAAHLSELDEAHRAAAAGHAPPPRRDAFASDGEHLRATLRYLFAERNAWLDWLVLLGAVVVGFVLAVGMLKVSRWSLGEHGGPRWRRVLRTVADGLHGPLYILFVAGGLAVGLGRIWLPGSFERLTWAVVLGLAVVAAFWMAWRVSASLTRQVGAWATPEGESPGEQVLDIVRKLVRLGLILLFVVVGAEIVFGTDFTALLAGLGLVGVAVTLAAQDTLKDLFASVTIHVNRPFRLGDLVRFEGHFGTVEEIGFRMTRMRDLDGHLVTVPNTRIVSQLVENVSARRHVRRRFRLDLPYDTPVEKVARAVEIVRDVVRDAGDLDEDEGVQVHFDEFGPHSLRVLVQYHYAEGDYWASKEKATEIDLALLERLREEDIAFAFPTQTIHLEDELPEEMRPEETREEADAAEEDDDRAEDPEEEEEEEPRD